MAFPMDMYEDMFKEKTGAKFTQDELKYVFVYSDSSRMSSSKKIYSHALYCMKRFYPLFLIRLIVQMKVKQTFMRENAPQSIQLLYKDFAEIILYSAMKKYGASYGGCEK